MKAVFFKCEIPLDIYTLDASGNISVETIVRSMEQGEVVDCTWSDDFMEIGEAIWWGPDRKLFNLIGLPKPQESCCGGSASKDN